MRCSGFPRPGWSRSCCPLLSDERTERPASDWLWQRSAWEGSLPRSGAASPTVFVFIGSCFWAVCSRPLWERFCSPSLSRCFFGPGWPFCQASAWPRRQRSQISLSSRSIRRSEWDSRIGWLQTFYGSGQVIGLVLAGVIGETRPESGLWLAGGIGGLAIIPAVMGTRQGSGVHLPHKPVLSRLAHHAEWPAISPQHLYHHMSMQGLRTFFAPFRASFGLFLFAWLLSFSGSAAFFSFYPVVMQNAYGVLPGLSSPGYALAAGLGLLLYAPAGRWSGRQGPLAVLRYALVLRIAAFTALTLLAVVSLPGRGWLSMLSLSPGRTCLVPAQRGKHGTGRSSFAGERG